MKKILTYVQMFGIVLCMMLTSFISNAANITAATTGGNWNATTTWVGLIVPVAGDNVTIPGDATVTVNVATAACATLIINTADNNKTGTLNFTSAGILTVSGNITIGGNGNRNGALVMTNGGILKIGGAFILDNFTFTAGTGTIDYNAAGVQTVSTALGSYNNLTLSNSGAKTVSGATVNRTLSIQGTASATGTSPTYAANAIVEYNGSSPQTTTNVEFPGTGTNPANLRINNANGVTLNAAKSLNGQLILANGVLTTTATNLLTINDNGTSTAGSNSSFVNGPVRKNGNDAFTFPVGKSGLYSPIRITAPDNVADAFSAEYIRASATALGGVGPGLFRVSNCEYWNLNKINDVGAPTSVDVTIGWFPGSGCGGSGYITDLTGIVVAHFNGATWDTWAGSTSGNPTTGTVTRTAVNTFSPFTIGSTVDNGNPLPVRFSDVRAFEKVAGVQIEWTNQTETNIVNYVVERSANGRDFTPVNQLAARGNMGDKESYMSIDATPITGANFYRIKATEFDGKTIYSKLLKVVIGEKQTGLAIYPNPVRGNELTIGYTAAKGQYTLQVVNAVGQQVMNQQINHPGGTISQTFTLPGNVKTGMYNLLISGDNYKQTKMFIVQ